jgi:hypothetical protein
MKAKDFGLFLEAFADVVGAQASPKELLPIFAANPVMDVKAICKLTENVNPGGMTPGGNLQSLLTSLKAMRRCLGDNVKKALADDLVLFTTTLDRFKHVKVAEFAAAVIEQMNSAASPNAKKQKAAPRQTAQEPAVPPAELVKTYLSALEEALGNDTRFTEVFERLKNDKNLKAPQVKQLAKEFANASGKTKDDALFRILARHQKLMGTEARAKATGGRTAA